MTDASPTAPSPLDRRAARRVSLATQVRTVAGGDTIVGYTRDISMGGVFIETESPAAKGAEVMLRFKLREPGPILEARAVVVYALEAEGMGLRFLDPPADFRRALEEFVG
ncbi:MAG: PilZ domain-containing protein [Terriglobia bacterium]